MKLSLAFGSRRGIVELKKPEHLWQIRWHFCFWTLTIITAAAAILAMFLNSLAVVFYICLALTGAVATFAILVLMYEATKALTEQNKKLDTVATTLRHNEALLGRINSDIQLSETVKNLIHHDTDRNQLRQAVIEKLHQQDFTATYAMIDDIERVPGYQQVAQELRKRANDYRNATDNERANQVIAYIEKLFEQYQWTTAGVQIERLIKKFPDSATAKTMPQKLAEQKEKRKKELLAFWDKAIKKQDTDNSLRVLNELDLYLTPSEGLALQEAASEVFKNKLHNLGVRFSLAVSDKHWNEAMETGEEICRDFPNSKMSGEIRSKIPILRELARK